MDDFSSESDVEVFESAEESFDEDSEKNVAKKSDKNKRLQQKPEVKKPVVRDNDKSSGDVSSKETPSAQDNVAYRKRPDKAKHTTKPVTAPRTAKTKSGLKPDVIATDSMLLDITTNFSKNINKGLNTIQQTSSNVKDLIFSSLPGTAPHPTDSFSYDDTPLPPTQNSPPSSSTSSDSSNVIPSHDSSILPSNKTKSDPIEKTKTILQTGLFKLLSVDNEESKNKKLFTSDKSNFQIPEITQLIDFDQTIGENTAMSEKPNTKQQRPQELPPPTPITPETANLIEDDRGPKQSTDADMRKQVSPNQATSPSENKSSHKPISQPQKSSPATPLTNRPRQKSPLSSNQCQSNQMHPKERNKVGDSVDNDNINLHNKITGSPKSLKKKNKKTLSQHDTDNNNLVSIESCYAICEQLKHTGDIEDTSVKTYNIEENITDWKDPITGWITKTTTSDDNLEERHLKETSAQSNDKGVKAKTNRNNTNEGSVSPKECDKSTSGKEENVPEVPLLDLKLMSKSDERNDGWDDFDFSDSEDLDVLNSNDTPREKTTPEPADLAKSKGSNGKQKSKECESNPVKCDMEVNVKSKPYKKEVSADASLSSEVEEKDDGWDWDQWSDEEEKKEEEKLPKNTKESEKHPDSEIWPGWETFGQKQEEKQTQSNWGSWGVNILLDKASAVTQGISNALESSLGAPDAQTLARMDQEDRKRQKEGKPLELTGGGGSGSSVSSDINLFSAFGITDLVAGVTSKIVDHSKFQEIGSKVITGGLDTLESFGKKTMEVLQEGDPGLRSKRALLLGQNKPVLSQVLKEIRDKTERELKETEKREMERRCHFESMFDDYQGLVHLEALEMLSKQCELKLEQIRSGMNSEEQEDLDGVLEEIQQLCSLDEYDLNLLSNVGDFNQSLTKAVVPLKDEISIQKIFEVQKDIEQWLQSSSDRDLSPVLVHHKLVSTLAQLTAAIVHQFHKAGELLSVKECRKTVEEIDTLSEMTHILIKEINKISNRFISLSKETFKGTENLGPLMKKIDLVMNNSTTYIKQAFNLLIPVLQIGAAV